MKNNKKILSILLSIFLISTFGTTCFGMVVDNEHVKRVKIMDNTTDKIFFKAQKSTKDANGSETVVQNFDFDDDMKYVYTIQTKSKDEPNIAVVTKYERKTGKCLSHAELGNIGHAESLEVIKTYSNGDVQMITTSSNTMDKKYYERGKQNYQYGSDILIFTYTKAGKIINKKKITNLYKGLNNGTYLDGATKYDIKNCITRMHVATDGSNIVFRITYSINDSKRVGYFFYNINEFKKIIANKTTINASSLKAAYIKSVYNTVKPCSYEIKAQNVNGRITYSMDTNKQLESKGFIQNFAINGNHIYLLGADDPEGKTTEVQAGEIFRLNTSNISKNGIEYVYDMYMPKNSRSKESTKKEVEGIKHIANHMYVNYNENHSKNKDQGKFIIYKLH